MNVLCNDYFLVRQYAITPSGKRVLSMEKLKTPLADFPRISPCSIPSLRSAAIRHVAVLLNAICALPRRSSSCPLPLLVRRVLEPLANDIPSLVRSVRWISSSFLLFASSLPSSEITAMVENVFTPLTRSKLAAREPCGRVTLSQRGVLTAKVPDSRPRRRRGSLATFSPRR